MSSIPVNVTKHNIDFAIKRDSHHCMIADAIQEKFSWARYISVDIQSIRFSDTEKGLRYIYLTPPIAVQALLAFDQGKRVKPFRFTLNRNHGYTRTMRCRLPITRVGKKYAKNAKRIMPSKWREYGMRKLDA